MHTRFALLFMPPLVALAACSQQGAPTESPEDAASNTPAASFDQTPSPTTLEPLSDEDIAGAGNLNGELGCSFTTEIGGRPLLVAMADVVEEARGAGVVRLGERVVPIAATTTGGFGAMADAGEFTGESLGKAITIDVDETGDEPARGHESPPYPALLALRVGESAPQDIAGFWTCGP